MKELARLKSGLNRVFRNVPSQVPELFLGPYQVIEGVLLPEASLTSENSVDFSRREPLPGFALGEHSDVPRKYGEHVNVIGHNHKVEQLVSIAIKIRQAVRNDLSKCRTLEFALTMTPVKFLVPASSEQPRKLLLRVWFEGANLL